MSETSSHIIRNMQAGDWPSIRRIYADGIRGGDATFEEVIPDQSHWDAAHRQTCRLVAIRNEEVLGWAALTPYSQREAYAGVAETSLYVAFEAQRQGVGRGLLEALIDAAEADGVWTLQAGIFPENEISIALHQSCGFRVVGTRERLGRRDGHWRDVVLMERRSAKVGKQ